MSAQPSSKPRFEAVTPRLPVADVEKSLSFYVDALGFELGWTWGTPMSHANVCRDSIGFDLIAVPEGRRGTAMAYVQIDGVDAYHSDLISKSVAVSDLQDRPYGMRDFEVIDSDGNRLVFGEPISAAD